MRAREPWFVMDQKTVCLIRRGRIQLLNKPTREQLADQRRQAIDQFKEALDKRHSHRRDVYNCVAYDLTPASDCVFSIKSDGSCAIATFKRSYSTNVADMCANLSQDFKNGMAEIDAVLKQTTPALYISLEDELSLEITSRQPN